MIRFEGSNHNRKAGRWATAALALVAGGYYYFVHRRKRSLRRQVSFRSLAMARGGFPPETNVPASTINSAMYFGKKDGGCPSVTDVAKQIVQPMLVYERLSQSLDLQTQEFRPPPQSYTASDLVRELIIHGDENTTIHTVFSLMQDELDKGRNELPWWEIVIVRNQGHGSSACVLRVHHTVGDGLSLVHAFQKTIVTLKGTPLELRTDTSWRPDLHTGTKKQSVWATFWSLLEATHHVFTLATTKFDDDTAFSKHNYSGMVHSRRRELLLFPDIPLPFVNTIKTAAKCTVNDVLMAAVSQAIYEYCLLHDDPVLKEKGTKLQCRALVAVGFPRSPAVYADPVLALSNSSILASCDMAVGQTNIVERLHQIHANTTAMKETPRAYMQLMVQNYIAPYFSRSYTRQATLDIFSRHSLILTNVRGPPQKCLLAGKVGEKVQLLCDNIVTQVNLMSYADTLYGNIIYDPVALPKLAPRFGVSFTKALVDLAQAFGVEVPKEIHRLVAGSLPPS